MISVSDAWKTSHRQKLVPESFIEINYLLTDPDVQKDLSVSVSSDEAISDKDSILDESNKSVNKYTTLEDGLFLLDSDEKYIPTDYGETGYVSRIWSDNNGLYTTPIVLNMSASKLHENIIPGVTITWSKAYQEYAVKFEIKVYKDNTLIASKLVEDNRSINNVVIFDFDDFNRIMIEVLEWCKPNRRCRIEEFLVGVYNTYTKNDLMSYEHEQICDLLSGSLPKNSITFNFDNSDSKWNPLNKDGFNKYILERQEVSVRYGYEIDNDVEWIDVGEFYMIEWNIPSNGLEASFTARDLIEFMNDDYKGVKSGTLYQICEAAFIQANLPLKKDGSKRYSISENLKNYSTTLGDDKTYKIKEVIQLCANAGMCIIHQDSSGIIKIESKVLYYTYYNLDSLVNYKYPEISVSKELKSVDVNQGLGSYNVNLKGETQTISNDFIIDGTHANQVAEWIGNTLKFRNTISGEARMDPRVEVTDMVSVESKFGVNHGVYLTDVKLTYNGAFKGEYKGRIFEFEPIPASYVGLPNSGEV